MNNSKKNYFLNKHLICMISLFSRDTYPKLNKYTNKRKRRVTEFRGNKCRFLLDEKFFGLFVNCCFSFPSNMGSVPLLLKNIGHQLYRIHGKHHTNMICVDNWYKIMIF